MKTYIKLTDSNYYGAIPRCGSYSFCHAIARDIRPVLYSSVMDNIHLAEGSDINSFLLNYAWHSKLQFVEKPPREAITFLPIRDPVERFKSAFARVSDGRTVDQLLDLIEQDVLHDHHFESQLNWIPVNNRIYKFPEHASQMASDIGLNDLIGINTTNGGKPALTAEQLARVEAIYAEDVALYNSITEAGQTYTAPPEPATDELKAGKIQELESDRYQAEVAGITLPDGKFVRTDKGTQAELGKALSIISTVNPSLEIDWKFPDGEVVHMDAAQIQQIAGAVFTHVQATRTAYKDKAVLVEAATTKDELNAITW